MQKIMVCIKRVVDYNVRMRVKPDGSGVMLDGVKMSVNPFDEIALEEALRIKERGGEHRGGRGQHRRRRHPATAAHRPGHGRGSGDSGTDGRSPWSRLTAAQTFLALAKKENPDLIFLGKQAIDDDANQTGQMLAAIWERPQATYASKVEISGDQGGGHARSRCRPRNHRSGSAGGHHRRSALERAAVRQIAGHHEGQEKALGRHLARCARRERRASCSRP